MKNKKSYSLAFFERANNTFSSGPQNYLKSFRKQNGFTQKFLGPWDYARKTTEKTKFTTFEYGDQSRS